MKQKVQQHLARMDAWGKEMNVNHQKAEANIKANQDLLTRMEANRESDREQMLTEMSARMDANTK
jgi:hypothetical protein